MLEASRRERGGRLQCVHPEHQANTLAHRRNQGVFTNGTKGGNWGEMNSLEGMRSEMPSVYLSSPAGDALKAGLLVAGRCLSVCLSQRDAPHFPPACPGGSQGYSCMADPFLGDTGECSHSAHAAYIQPSTTPAPPDKNASLGPGWDETSSRSSAACGGSHRRGEPRPQAL